MHFPLFGELIVILALATGILLLFRRFKLPGILGFILTGMIAGPHGLGWVQEVKEVEALAEVGVILLLFVIGMEFSPYFGAFADLAHQESLGSLPTPDYDPQWRDWQSKAEVVGRESVSVPAGTFDAFKVEVWSNRRQTGSVATLQVEPVRVRYTLWYAPQVNRWVQREWTGWYRWAGVRVPLREDWISWRLMEYLPAPIAG